MDENNTYSVSVDNISCGEIDWSKITVAGGTITTPPPPKSILSIGGVYCNTSIPVDQHFNWFQKLMWKWCLGFKVEDYKEE